ncbi:hypothetical protein IWQ60_008454 [Tieghemiomyces parasiticus]|uniref:BHLH domain-containing protein n=1 Tax=Tieghemiomyces parasiticus TaxID=78921 RepID=A0A9W7ZXN3_9FUNG|nr:hypothetical protein IWQ60_008454 [Tieghemiomyces parasiticus]
MSTSNELPPLAKLHHLPPLGHSGSQSTDNSNTGPVKPAPPQLPSLGAYRFPAEIAYSPDHHPASGERSAAHPSSSGSPGHSDPAYPAPSPDAYRDRSLLTEPSSKMEDPFNPYRRHSIAAASRFHDGGSPLAREMDPRSDLPPPPPISTRHSLHPHDVRLPGPRDLPSIPELNGGNGGISPNKRKDPPSPTSTLRPDGEVKRHEPHRGEYYPPPPAGDGRPGPLPYPRNRLLPPGPPGAFDPQNRRFSLPAAAVSGMPRPGAGPGHPHGRSGLPPPPPPAGRGGAGYSGHPYGRPPSSEFSQPPPPPPSNHPVGPYPVGPNSGSPSGPRHDGPEYPDSFNMARRASMPVIALEGLKGAGSDRFHHQAPYPGRSDRPYGYPPPFPPGLNGHGYVAHREIAKSETPYSRSPELRVSHKMAERKRRREMKDLFDELRDALPIDKSLKTSKWEILSKAVDFINDLRKSEHDYREEVESLRNQLAVLKQGRRSST